MKILYLLFAVLFLVLQSTPGLTQSPACFMRCIRSGGLCYRRCPPGTYYLGRCCRQFFCCRRF